MGRVKEINPKINKVKKHINNAGHLKKNLTSCVKMPNFEAIHKKRFKQMESIIDHVARKAERAKELSKSSVKKSNKKQLTFCNGIPEEVISTKKNASNEKASTTKKSKLNVSEVPSSGRVPKARQKINFGNESVIKVPSIEKSSANENDSKKRRLVESERVINNNKIVKKFLKKTENKSILNPSKNQKVNPLSSLNSKQFGLSSQKEQQQPNKHVHLFKSRQILTNEKNKENEFVKKIRVNRRFELQMAFRNRKE